MMRVEMMRVEMMRVEMMRVCESVCGNTGPDLHTHPVTTHVAVAMH